jgi:hypothetical protein
MSLRQLLLKPLSPWCALIVALCVVALAVAGWFARIVYDGGHFSHYLLSAARGNAAAGVCQNLLYTTNPPLLDGTGSEFFAELAGIREGRPWVIGEPLQPRDPKRCVRIIITNEEGEALHLLLQEKEHPSEDRQFRLLSYTKITQLVAPPNGRPTTSVGDPEASEGRHR